MELECPICISPFDEVEVRPLVGICGHSMCESCLRPGISCSICRKEDAFRFRTVNYQLIELISKQVENLKLQEDMKKQLADALADKKSTTSIDEVDDMQGYVKCSNCKEKTSEESARICLECSHMYSVLEMDWEEPYCVSCWLESEHSDHNTIIYSEVKDDLVELRRVYMVNLDGNQRCSALADSIRIRGTDGSKWYGEHFQNLDKMKTTMDMLHGREKQIINHVDDLRNILFSFEKFNTDFKEELRKFKNDTEKTNVLEGLESVSGEEDACEPVPSQTEIVVFHSFGSCWIAHIVSPEESVDTFAERIQEKHNIDGRIILYGNESTVRCTLPKTVSWTDYNRLEHGTLASNGIVDLSRVRVICDAQNDDCEDKDLSEEDCRL